MKPVTREREMVREREIMSATFENRMASAGNGGRRRIVVIGGGFSGAAFAVHLARATPLTEIEVIEPRAMVGGGLAYSTADLVHRINVPSSRMSLYPGDETHFQRWLERSGAAGALDEATTCDGRCFPPRILFGRYVADEFARVAKTTGRLRHVRARAMSVRADAAGYAVTLEDGSVRLADVVVLALSHPPPEAPSVFAGLGGTEGFVTDSWAEGALDGIAADARVLIVGTGLTMADVVATLDARGHRGPITALSRRGLTSRGHCAGTGGKLGDFSSTPATSAAALLSAIRAAVRDGNAAGRPWQDVLDAARNQGTAIWSALPVVERRRLVRHLRPYWDVHRFRIAPQTEAILARRRREGTLSIIAASLRAAERTSDGFEIAVRPRGTDGVVRACYDAVVITTGPGHGGIFRTNPALASLAQAGLAGPDPVGLGIHVDGESRVVAVDGRPLDDLLVVGPLARGTFGELMGVPEVARHTHAVAQSLAARLDSGAGIKDAQEQARH